MFLIHFISFPSLILSNVASIFTLPSALCSFIFTHFHCQQSSFQSFRILRKYFCRLRKTPNFWGAYVLYSCTWNREKRLRKLWEKEVFSHRIEFIVLLALIHTLNPWQKTRTQKHNENILNIIRTRVLSKDFAEILNVCTASFNSFAKKWEWGVFFFAVDFCLYEFFGSVALPLHSLMSLLRICIHNLHSISLSRKCISLPWIIYFFVYKREHFSKSTIEKCF